MEKKIAEHVDRLFKCNSLLVKIYQKIYRHQVLLSGDKGSINEQKRIQILKQLRGNNSDVSNPKGLIFEAINSFKEAAEKLNSDKQLEKAFLRRLVDTNATLFEQLAKKSKEQENDMTFCPSLKMLQALDPQVTSSGFKNEGISTASEGVQI